MGTKSLRDYDKKKKKGGQTGERRRENASESRFLKSKRQPGGKPEVGGSAYWVKGSRRHLTRKHRDGDYPKGGGLGEKKTVKTSLCASRGKKQQDAGQAELRKKEETAGFKIRVSSGFGSWEL